MVTRKQKYNGNNNFNNSIEVDYETKKVKFKPIKGSMSSFGNYSLTAGLIRKMVGFVILVVCSAQFATIIFAGIEIDRARTSKYVVIMIATWYLSYYVVLLMFALIKPLRTNYPKINAKVIHFYNIVIRGENVITKGKVNLDTIEHNRLVIDDFHNIFLEYKMTGEVAEHIKRIFIQNKFTDNPNRWRLIFEWKKRPKKGYLELEYM